MNNYIDYLKLFQKDFNYDNFLTFKNNVQLIEKHNNQNHSYELEINELSDKKISFTNILYQPSNTTYKGDNVNVTVPFSIDWRQKDIITNVKNQGHCGSCWSFSATGSIEAIHAISTGNLLNISEQQLVDCSGNYGNQGCNGGSMDNAFKYVIDNGLCSEKEYPYTGQEEQCQECKNVVNISDFKDVVPNNEEILKKVVYQQPVSVAIQANLPSFQAYKTGVYSDPSCGKQLDHGVLIVGYGHDFFHNMDYWIVKNSWGPHWGEKGYIRIQRNIDQDSGLCGIAMQPSIPIN
jgi:C1A family cysteine protease